MEPPRRQRGRAVPGPVVVSRCLRVSHGPLHIRGGDAQAALRELMAAAPRVIIDYGKPYDGDFEFRPNELTPRHFKCAAGRKTATGPTKDLRQSAIPQSSLAQYVRCSCVLSI